MIPQSIKEYGVIISTTRIVSAATIAFRIERDDNDADLLGISKSLIRIAFNCSKDGCNFSIKVDYTCQKLLPRLLKGHSGMNSYSFGRSSVFLA